MGAGTQTTTQNTTAKPYGPAKPLINTALDDAMKAYSKGVGGQVFTGSTVIPFSKQTVGGMDGTMANANWNANNPNGITAQSKNIIKNGGLTGAQSQAVRGMQNLAGNANLNGYLNGTGLNQFQTGAVNAMQDLYNSPALDAMMSNGGLDAYSATAANRFSQMANNQGLNNLANGDGLNDYQRQSMNNWQNTANSQFDLNANPAFQKVQQNAIDQATGAVSRQAAAAGRYGSGANQQVLSREIGNTAANLANNEYRNWQNRVDQANQNVFSGGATAEGQRNAALGMQQGFLQGAANLGQQGMNNQMGAMNFRNGLASGINSIGQSAYGQQMGAANTLSGLQNSIFNAGQAGQQNLATAYNNMNLPNQSKMAVGSMYEDLAKRTMDDRLRVFNEKQNMPWDQIGRLMGVGNLTSTYAPRNTVSTQPGPNPLLQTLGGVSSGIGLLGGLGLF